MKKQRRSALETFDGCPYRYEQTVLLGVDDQGDETVRGRAFHEAAFRYVETLAEAAVSSDHELAEQALSHGIAFHHLPAHLTHEVARIWRRWTARFELNLDAYLHAEEVLENRQFRWIPDLVYVFPDGPRIIDYKTYYKGLTKAQAEREFQLRCYLLWALEAWPGFPRYTFEFQFVRIGYNVALTFTPEQIEAWRPEVDGVLASLTQAEAEGKFPATPGSHCALCRLNCPVIDNPRRMPVRFVDDGQALAAAGEILALQQRIKVLRKSLGAWCNANGPVTVNGTVFSHEPSTSVRYPARAVIDRLLALGAEHEADQLSVSASGVRAADPLGKLRDDAALAELARDTTKWTFKGRRAGALAADDDEEE